MNTPGLQQGMNQTMVASASMQLFMRTLQATSMELNQQVSRAVASNPALEELPPAEDADNREIGGRDAHYEAMQRHDAFINSLPQEETLQHYLQHQIRTSGLPIEQEQACIALVEHLDEHGRFTHCVQSLAQERNISPTLLHQALQVIHELDPPGVGAVDLRDSLIIQLKRAGESSGLAMTLVNDYWQDLVAHRYDAAARKIGVDPAQVQLAAQRISRLNPDPGSDFAKVEQNIITPDIIVSRQGQQLHVSLTGEGIPRLALSAEYRNMMAEHADKQELRQYLSRCFREGRDLIRAIDQRQHTILTVAKAIVSRQRDFFFKGEQSLKPLRLEDIAADTNLHLSTISRAINGKYLRCEFGVWELRRFFPSALPSSNGDCSHSSNAALVAIRQLVASEKPSSPLSDADIAAALANMGISIARRTVAKYRDILHILPASQRKRA